MTIVQIRCFLNELNENECRQRVNEWMNKWMIEWVNEWMSEWVNEWMSEWMSEWVSEWMNEWVSEWVNEWVSEWVNKWMNEWMNEWMNGWRVDSERCCVCVFQLVVWACMRPAVELCLVSRLTQWTCHSSRNSSTRSVSSTESVRDTNTKLSRSALTLCIYASAVQLTCVPKMLPSPPLLP